MRVRLLSQRSCKLPHLSPPPTPSVVSCSSLQHQQLQLLLHHHRQPLLHTCCHETWLFATNTQTNCVLNSLRINAKTNAMSHETHTAHTHSLNSNTHPSQCAHDECNLQVSLYLLTAGYVNKQLSG